MEKSSFPIRTVYFAGTVVVRVNNWVLIKLCIAHRPVLVQNGCDLCLFPARIAMIPLCTNPTPGEVRWQPTGGQVANRFKVLADYAIWTREEVIAILEADSVISKNIKVIDLLIDLFVCLYVYFKSVLIKWDEYHNATEEKVCSIEMNSMK